MTREPAKPKARRTAKLSEALGLGGSGVVVFTGAGGRTELMLWLGRELASAGRVLVTSTTQIMLPATEQAVPLIVAGRYRDMTDALQEAFRLNRRVTAGRGLLSDGKLRGLPRGWIDRLWEGKVADYILVDGDNARGQPLKMPATDEPVIPQSATLVVPIAGAEALSQPIDERTVYRPGILAARLSLQFRQRIEPKHVAQALLGPEGCARGAPEGCAVIPTLTGTSTVDPVRSSTTIYELAKLGAKRVVVLGGAAGSPLIEVYQ